MDDCGVTCYVFRHFVENTANFGQSHCIETEGGNRGIDSLEFPVANLSQAMMHNIVSVLCGLGRISDNMHNGHKLGVAAGDGAYVGQLAWSEGRHDGTDAIDSCVSVSSIA